MTAAMELLKPINLLMVKVGTEPGLEAIPSHIKAFNPRVRTYGIISHPSQPHTFDEVITSSWESMLGAHPEYLKKGLYVRPELFKRLRDKEGQLLRMFERVAIHDLTTVANPIDPIPLFEDSTDDRVQLFLRQVAFWDHVFDQHTISAVVAQNYGHNGWDAVVQAVAEAREVPYLFFHEVRPFLGSLYLHESVSDLGNLALGRKLVMSAVSRGWWAGNSEPRNQVLRNQVGLVQMTPRDPVGEMSTPRLRSIIHRVGDPTSIAPRLIRSARRRLRNRNSIRDEKRAITQAAIPEKYLFCELQPNPNATTAVKGWMFPDQRETIAFIAAHLPIGWGLVVKESDRQWSRMYPRRRNFWTQIAHIPNVYVIDSISHSEPYVEKCQGVVETSFSSLAFNAVSNGIPVIIVGHTHIGELQGVRVVTNCEELKIALQEVSQRDGLRIARADVAASLEKFVESVADSTIEGALSSMPSFSSSEERSLYVSRLTTNVAGVICSWLAETGCTRD